MESDSFIARTARLSTLGDRELLSLMKRISAAERTLSVYALAQLGEIQRRELYEDAGYPSMFAYCVGELRYSEGNAYRRLQAAGAARRFPEVLSLLKDGQLTVCALSVVAKHLTRENRGGLLKRIEGKSVRDVERLAAEFAPRPDTRDTVRALPSVPVPMPEPMPVPEVRGALEARSGDRAVAEARPAPAADLRTAPEPRPVPAVDLVSVPEPAFARSPAHQRVVPLAPKRILFSFTGSDELDRVIRRLKELLWHKYPEGRLEDVLLEAGRNYLALKDPELQLPSKPRPPRRTRSRAVARWVRSTVYRRDGGRCTFTSSEGRRCEARRGLEYDHIRPWALGGHSDDPENIRLLCRAHNQLAARRNGLC